MRSPLAVAFMVLFAIPAVACVPPPGLAPQQWYAMCGNDMERGFALGVGGRQSHDAFMQSMYRMYRSARPTYNPQLQQQQQQLANTMSATHQQFMQSFNQQGIDRTNNFNSYMDSKWWQQNEVINHIQDRHCAVWDTAHTFCISVAN